MGSIRFMLALSVLAFHSGLPVLGPFAVYLFYFLSGYSIYAALHKIHTDGTSYLNFWRKRFKRLIPFYLFVTLGVISLFSLASIVVPDQLDKLTPRPENFQNIDVVSIFKNLLPTLYFSGSDFQLNPSVFYVPPWWSVVMEIGFYLTLFMLVVTLKKLTWALELMTLLFLILHFVLVVRSGQDLGALNSLVYFNWFGTFIFFLIGAIVRKYRSTSFNSTKLKSISQLIVVFVLFLFSTFVTDPTQIFNGHPVIGYFVVVYLLMTLMLFYVLSLNHIPVNSSVDNRFAILSYRIYVSQSIAFPVLILFETNFITVSSFYRFVLVTLICISISLIPDIFLMLKKFLNVNVARF